MLFLANDKSAIMMFADRGHAAMIVIHRDAIVATIAVTDMDIDLRHFHWTIRNRGRTGKRRCGDDTGRGGQNQTNHFHIILLEVLGREDDLRFDDLALHQHLRHRLVAALRD